MTESEYQPQSAPTNPKDSYADALVIVVLTVIFVGSCIFWIAGQ